MTEHKRPLQWDAGWVCPHCHMERKEDGHDPCLGALPGVEYACCGHGGHGYSGGYVHFTNGKTIRFAQLTAVER